jgi:hypothetical protein
MMMPMLHDDAYASLIRDDAYASLINYNWFFKNSLVATNLYKYDMYLNLEKSSKHPLKYLIVKVLDKSPLITSCS